MSKKVKVAIQMDDIATINLETDSSFLLGLEAMNRKFELYYYKPEDLLFRNSCVMAICNRISLYDRAENYCEFGESALVDLSIMDVILVRQDPPYDMKYLTSTYILEKIKDAVLIVNNPTEIRNLPEKLFVCDFIKFTPKTLISSNLKEIEKFREEHKEIIIKPIYECGGRGVFKTHHGDKNLNSLIELMKKTYDGLILAQEYLPQIKDGDKRIILLDGKPIGAMLRLPTENDIRANMHAGGKVVKSTISKREEKICEIVGKELKRREIIFAGLDFIGEYITEINITSPTGLKQINQFNNDRLEIKIWDVIIEKLKLKLRFN